MEKQPADRLVKITRDSRTTADGMAACLGLSRTRIIQLVKEGILAKDDAGKYNIFDNFSRYISFKSNEKGEFSYDSEKALHEKAKRELTEIKLAELKGEMHKTEHIKIMVGGMVVVLKRRMLAIPYKLSPRLEGQTADEINDMLTKEIHGALTEVSSFDASKLGEQVDMEDTE